MKQSLAASTSAGSSIHSLQARPLLVRLFPLGAACAVVLLTGLAARPWLGDWCRFSPDSFRYLEAARTLHETGRLPEGRLVSPPGFPWLLAPLLGFGDIPAQAIRLALTACWAAAAALTYLLFRRELGDRLALAAGCSVSVSPLYLWHSTVVLSELPFVVLALVALLLATRWREQGEAAWWAAVAAGLVVAAAALVRSMGMVLVPCVAAALLFQRGAARGRRTSLTLLFLLSALAPLAAWQARESAYPPTADYVQDWTTSRSIEATDARGLALQWERLGRFGAMRLADLKAAMTPRRLLWWLLVGPADRWSSWLIGGSLALLSAGCLLFRRKPVDVFCACYLGVISIWPWDEGPRLVLPLVPTLVGQMIAVGRAVWIRWDRRTLPRAALSFTLALGLLIWPAELALQHSSVAERVAKASDRLGEMRRVTTVLRESLPAGASWLGVTTDGRETKVALLGAGYLARLPVTTIDVRESAVWPEAPHNWEWAVIERGLKQRAAQHWPIDPVRDFEGFSLVRIRTP